MVARYIRLQLFFELAAYVAITMWLHFLFQWSYSLVAALCILAAALGRLVMVLITTAIGFAHRSPREKSHHIGPRGTFAMVMREWGAMLMNTFFRFPFPDLALRRDPAPARDGRMPVVLIHGYFSNRGYFGPLVRRLEAHGVGPVLAPNFPSAFTTIEHYVERLAQFLEETCAASGEPQVVLVAHSMGGLVARAYVCAHGARRIRKLITIASPHNGTVHARLGTGPNAKQMERESRFIEDLCGKEGGKGPDCGLTSIYTPHDNLVAPQDTSRLPWARNIPIPGRGHVDILASNRLATIVLKELRECGVHVGSDPLS